ncbi:MAG: hypothetical protein AAGA84_04415 [Pseudomonadota bacterium]
MERTDTQQQRHRLRRRFVIGALLAMGGCLVATDPVLAQAPPTDSAAYSQDQVTLEQAVRKVRAQYKGRILAAESRGNGANKVHVIKILGDDGHVRTVRIRANPR